VLHASGVEFEAELPFPTLHELLMPVLDGRSHLPHPQAHALEAAFALRDDLAVDRFAVYVATLGLIASEASRRPVLCLVDDAHCQRATAANVHDAPAASTIGAPN
jgi:hypothetical protein